MSTTKIKSKAELYEAVHDEFFNLSDEDITMPFNIFNLCEKKKNYSIKTAELTTPGLRGVSLISKQPNLNCIILNSKLSEAEQNFHGFHEYCHTFLHNDDNSKFVCFDTPNVEQNSYVEWQANEGAAELMSPIFRFIPEFSKLYHLLENPQNWSKYYGRIDIYDLLALKYRYTPTVARLHISSLSYEIDQYEKNGSLYGIDILSTNELIKYRIVPTDYNIEIAKRKASLNNYLHSVYSKRFFRLNAK